MKEVSITVEEKEKQNDEPFSKTVERMEINEFETFIDSFETEELEKTPFQSVSAPMLADFSPPQFNSTPAKDSQGDGSDQDRFSTFNWLFEVSPEADDFPPYIERNNFSYRYDEQKECAKKFANGDESN